MSVVLQEGRRVNGHNGNGENVFQPKRLYYTLFQSLSNKLAVRLCICNLGPIPCVLLELLLNEKH